MSKPVEYQSLSQSPTVDTIDPTHHILFLEQGKIRRITHAHYLQNVMGIIPLRLTEIENTLSAGPLPSIWPAGRSLTLNGVMQGSAVFDGSADITIETTVRDGSLTISSVAGLGLKLLNLREVNQQHSTRLDKLTPKRITNTDVFTAAKERFRFSGTGLTNQPSTGNTFTYSSSYLLAQDSEREYVTLFAMSMTSAADTFIGIGVESPANRTLQWYRIWNEANFDPASKAQKHQPTFTGLAKFDDGIETVTLKTTGIVDHEQDVYYRKGVVFHYGNNRLLNINITENTEDGYFVDYGHFTNLPGVKLRFSTPGHVFEVGGVHGLHYNQHPVWHAGNFRPSQKLDATAAAVTADRLTLPFDLTLDGPVTGSASIHGGANVTLTVSIPANALSFNQIAGLENSLNTKFSKNGGEVLGTVQLYHGVVTTPQTLLTLGWGDQKPRWAFHLNTNTELCLQEFDVIGNTPTNRIKITESAVEHTGTLISLGEHAALVAEDPVTRQLTRLYTQDKVVHLVVGNVEYCQWDNIGRMINTQFVAQKSEGFRFTSGEYGTILKSNGQEFNILITERLQSVNGTPSGLRPLCINLHTGQVTSTSAWDISNAVIARRVAAGWDSGVTGSVSCSNWFRASGQTGIYFNDFGGGWHMTDSDTVRTLNNKHVAGRSFIELSDLRYKQNVRPFEFKGRLKPITYEMFGITMFGFGAQDLLSNYPENVHHNKARDNYEVRYNGLMPVLSHQVNQAEDDIIELRSRVDSLERKNEELATLCEELLRRLDQTS